MESTNAIIELHHFSGGLRSILIGVQNRPDWIPDSDQVGLHNDIYPQENEFVIEFSRHKRKDKLITWIGVYSNGKDAVYGDRANYIGIGVWLINALPVNSYLLLDALFQICQLLVKNGPNEYVQSNCKNLLNSKSFSQNWIKDISILPRATDGIDFDVTQHPETIYIKSSNQDIPNNIKNIADSILLNCIKAEDNFRSTSRILYLILNPSSKIENIEFTLFSANPNPIKLILEYFSTSIEDNKSLDLENNSRFSALENKNKVLEEDNSIKSNQIKQLIDKNEKLNSHNQADNGTITSLEVRNQQLSEKLNNSSRRSEVDLLDELRKKIVGLAELIEIQTKDVKSKTDSYMNIQSTSYNNSNNEVLTRIKDLSNQIKEQKNNTPNSSIKIKISSEAALLNRQNMDDYRTSVSSFSNFFHPNFLKTMLVVVAFLLGISIYYFFSRKEEPKIEAVIPIQKNISTNDLENIILKLDVLSSKVDSIEDKLKPSNTLEEIKQTAPAKSPLNGKKNRQ